jgi:hypothetical protein
MRTLGPAHASARARRRRPAPHAVRHRRRPHRRRGRPDRRAPVASVRDLG